MTDLRSPTTGCPTVCRQIRKAPYYNAEILSRDIGIRFKGVEKN